MRTRTPSVQAVEFARPYAPVRRTYSPMFCPTPPAIAWDPVNRGAMIYATENVYDTLDRNGMHRADPRRGNGKEPARRRPHGPNLREILHW